MTKNNLEEQNYKKRKKSSDKVDDSSVSLSQRPALCWSKLNRNAENIVPRFPKLQQRSSKLRIKGMTTILEESLAVLNPTKMPSNSSITNSNISNTITDPSATSNDVDSLTLASTNEISPYPQSFTVFPLSVQLSHFFLGNHKKSTGSIKKIPRRRKSDLSLSDLSSTSVSIMERRPSILQCILSEVFNNGKDREVEGSNKMNGETKNKKNDEKKNKEIIKKESGTILRPKSVERRKCDKKEIFDEREVETKVQKENADNAEDKRDKRNFVGKFKGEGKKKEEYENDMGRVEKELRRREYEEMCRISREIRESREKESRELNKKNIDKYKSSRGCSRESNKSDGRRSRNKSKKIDKISRGTERRESSDRHGKGKENTDSRKKTRKRLKIFQRKTKTNGTIKRELESEEKKKLVLTNINNDCKKDDTVERMTQLDDTENKVKDGDKKNKTSNLSRESKADERQRKRRSDDCRSTKSKDARYESEESDNEIELQKKLKRKEEVTENEKHRNRGNVINFKEGDEKKVNEKIEKQIVVEKENGRLFEKKNCVQNKNERGDLKKVEIDDAGRDNKFEIKNDRDSREVEKYRKIKNKEKHSEKKDKMHEGSRRKKVLKVSRSKESREKYKNKEKKVDDRENNKSRIERHDRKLAASKIEKHLKKDILDVNKIDCFEDNEKELKDFKYSDELKNMMNKDIRGKRNNKSAKKEMLIVGDAGEGVPDHKVYISTHKPAEASKSEDTASYDRDNSFVKIKKSLKQFAEYSKLKLENKISSFSVNGKRNMNDSHRKHRFTKKPDKINVTINRTSNMQKVLQQNDACYKNLYSCENSHQVSKLKTTIRLEDLGSLKIPPFKPKSSPKINIDIQSEGDRSGNSIISPYESTGWNSSAVASTSLMIISDFSETEHSNASRKISFRDMIQELCSKTMMDRFPNFPINPYCFMTFNNYKRKHINKGTNTEITWTRDELKVNLNSARGISKAKIKVPQYQLRKVIMKNKSVNHRKKLRFKSSHEIQNSNRDVSSLASETSSKLDEGLSEARKNPAMKSVNTPNSINYQEIKTTADKIEEVEDMKIEHNQELIVKYENLVQKMEPLPEDQSQASNVQNQEQKSDVVTQTANNQHFENQSSVSEGCNLIESITASEHIRNIDEEVYDFSDETEEISKKKKNKKSRWYSNLFSRSFGDGKRIPEEIIESVTEDVSDKKKFISKIARPKSIRGFKEASAKIVEEEVEVEEKCAVEKKLEQDAGGSLESLAAALKEKTRLSFEAELKKIEEDFLIYKSKTGAIDDMKSDSNMFVENLESEEFIKKESLEVKTETMDDISQPIVIKKSGRISPKVPLRSHKIIPPTEKPQTTHTKKNMPMYRTQIPRKLPPLPPRDFPEKSNFINNETLLINMMKEKPIGFLPTPVKLTSSVSLISIKEVNSKTHSVSLQVMVPSKAVETNTSKSLIVGKPRKKSRLPLRIKNRNEKRRVDGVNSFTFPIEIDLKKAMAEAKSSGNVKGFTEASDYVAPSEQDLNCSLSHFVTSKFGSYMKRVKSFFVGQPESSITSIELKISDYQSVCTIFDERLRQISSSESDLPNYFNQPIIAVLAAKPAPLFQNEPLKEVPYKYKSHIPIDIEGFLYFIFTSLLRKYLEEEIALKAMVPCTLGQQYKAPKLSDSILVDPNPVLNKVSSIQCKYDEIDMRKTGFVKNITITVEDMENDDAIKKLPPNLKRLKDIEIKNEYVFEIVYDEIPDMEDKCVQTDFEEEEVEEEEEEEEEIQLSDKEIQTDIEEWDDDMVEVISISLQTDDEDNAEIFSIRIKLDNSSDEEDGLVEVISIALQTEGEEDVIEIKSASMQFDDASKEGDNLVKVNPIAIPSDGEDNVEIISTRTQFDDSSVDEIGGGDSYTGEKYLSEDKKNSRYNKMEEQESDMIRESDFDGTTDSIADKNSLTNAKNNSTLKLEETEYEETTEDSSNIREASSSNWDEYKETTKDNSNLMFKENLEPNVNDQISDESEDENDALGNSESVTEVLIKSSSMEADKIEVEETDTSVTPGLQDVSQLDIIYQDADKPVEETDKKNLDKKIKGSNLKSILKRILNAVDDESQENPISVRNSLKTHKPEIRPSQYIETDNLDTISSNEQLESESSESITLENKSNRTREKLRNNQTKNKKPTEDTTESTKITASSTETPSLPVRPTRSDDFTLVLEPTQKDVELIIGFKDNDLKLILPPVSSKTNIVHVDQDMVYEVLSILFANLKENKNFVRKMHKVLQNANKDISKNLFNSKAVARAREFIRNILDSVIEEEGVCILDAKKILQIEENYRDICTTTNNMHECAELKKTSYNSILNVDNSSFKRCLCGNMKEHTKSCPCIPKENRKKKWKRLSKDSNELNKDFIVLHAFERRPTSDELNLLNEDKESKPKESNEVELERSYNSLLKNLNKASFSDFKPFVEPINVFRFKEEQFNKNPPILWSLAKKFLRNRRNRNEERKRLAKHRRSESVKSKHIFDRKSRKRSNSSSRIGSSSQDPFEESCCSLLFSQSEFIQNENSFESAHGVLLRNLNEEEEEIEKKVELLYPKCLPNEEKVCLISSRCVTPSCSSGIIWSYCNIPSKKNIKKNAMHASTSDREAFPEKDTNDLKKDAFKTQEDSKEKESEENKTNSDDKAIPSGIVNENAGDTASGKKESVNKSKGEKKGPGKKESLKKSKGEKKEKRNKKKSKDIPSSSTPRGQDAVGTGDEKEIHKSEQNILNAAPPISSPPSTHPEKKDEATKLTEEEPKGNNVVGEVGTNTIHVPKKIKRKKADKTDKETETEKKIYEPKGDVDVIVVEKPEVKSTGKQRCRLCEEFENQKCVKKKSKKKYFKDKDSLTIPKDKTNLSVKEPDENDFKEEPEDNEINKMDAFKTEAAPVGKTRPTFCDTLKRITVKKDKLPNDKMLQEKPEKSEDNKESRPKHEQITLSKSRPTFCDTLKRITSKKDCKCSNDDKHDKLCQEEREKSGRNTKGEPKDKVTMIGKRPTLCDNLKRITSKKENVDKKGKPLVLLTSDMPLEEIDKLLSRILTPEDKTDLAMKLVPAFSESSIPPSSNTESLKKHNSAPNIKTDKNKKTDIAKDINESKDPTSSKSSSPPSSKRGALKRNNSGPKSKPDKNKKTDVKDINETNDAILSDSSNPPSSNRELLRNNYSGQNIETEEDKKTNLVEDIDKSKDAILSESSTPASNNKETIKKTNSPQNIKPEKNKKTDITKYINQSKDGILAKLNKTDHPKLGLCEEIFKSLFYKKKPKALSEIPTEVVSCACKRETCKTQDLHTEKEQVNKKGVKKLKTASRSKFYSSDDTPAVPTNSAETIQKKQSVLRNPSLLEKLKPFATEITQSDNYTETEPLEDNQKVTINELPSDNKRKNFVSTASDPIDIHKSDSAQKNLSISPEVDQVAKNDELTKNNSSNEENIKQKSLEITDNNEPEKEFIKGNDSNMCACQHIYDSSENKKRNRENIQDAPTQTNKAYVASEEKDETGTQTSVNNLTIAAAQAKVVSAGINTNKTIEPINEENEESGTQTSVNNMRTAAAQDKVVSAGVNTNKTIGPINEENKESDTQTSVNNMRTAAAQAKVVSAGVNTNKNIGAINEGDEETGTQTSVSCMICKHKRTAAAQPKEDSTGVNTNNNIGPINEESEETGTQTSVNNMGTAAAQDKVVSAGVNTNKNIGAINEENEETGTQTSVSCIICNNKRTAAAQGKVVSTGVNTNKISGPINEENDETGTQTSVNNLKNAAVQAKVSDGINTNKNIRVINAKVQTSNSLLPPTCPAKERTWKNLSSKNPEESLYILRKVQGSIKPKSDCNQIGNILRFIKNMNIKSPTGQNENKLHAIESEENEKELQKADPSRTIDAAPKTTKPGEKKGCKGSCKLKADDFCGRRQKYGKKKLLDDDKDMTHRVERRNSRDKFSKVIGEGDKGHKKKPKSNNDDRKSSKSGVMPATKITSNIEDPYISDTKMTNKHDEDIHDKKKMSIDDSKADFEPEPHEPDKFEVKRSLDPEPHATIEDNKEDFEPEPDKLEVKRSLDPESHDNIEDTKADFEPEPHEPDKLEVKRSLDPEPHTNIEDSKADLEPEPHVPDKLKVKRSLDPEPHNNIKDSNAYFEPEPHEPDKLEVKRSFDPEPHANLEDSKADFEPEPHEPDKLEVKRSLEPEPHANIEETEADFEPEPHEPDKLEGKRSLEPEPHANIEDTEAHFEPEPHEPDKLEVKRSFEPEPHSNIEDTEADFEPEPHEPDKLEVKRSLDPEPRADEIINVIEEDDTRDSHGIDIYDIKYKKKEDYETDPDSDYDKPIIDEKKPIEDLNDTLVDTSLEDIQNDVTPMKDDTAKKNNDKVSNFENSSIGVQVNLKENRNCNCKTRSSAELLLTPAVEIDKKFNDTTNSDTAFPIPNEDATVVQPNKINEPHIPKKDSSLSKINKSDFDVVKYCLCKNETKEDSVSKSRESFKKVEDNHGGKTVNSKEKKINAVLSNGNDAPCHKNSQVAKESKLKKGLRNLSNIAGSKSSKLMSLVCPSNEMNKNASSEKKMLGISPDDICRGQGNSEVIQNSYFAAVRGARSKKQSCGNDQLGEKGMKQTETPTKHNIFFYKNIISPPKGLETSNKINENEQNDIDEFDEDIHFTNVRDSLTVTLERKSQMSRNWRNQDEENERDIEDDKYTQNVVQAFTVHKPKGRGGSVSYDTNKNYRNSDYSYTSEGEGIFEEELLLIKEIQKRALFKDKRKSSVPEEDQFDLDFSESEEELKKKEKEVRMSEMLHEALIKSCDKKRKRLIKINETDTPSIIARKERGYEIAEGLDFTDSGHEQLRAENFIKNRARALADILNFDESEFDIENTLKYRNKNPVNVRRRSLLKTKPNRKSTDYKHSGVRVSSIIELENTKSSQVGEYLDEEGRYHSTLLDIYRPNFRTSIFKSNRRQSNLLSIKRDKNECQPTVKTSIKFSDSNQLDIEGDENTKSSQVGEYLDEEGRYHSTLLDLYRPNFRTSIFKSNRRQSNLSSIEGDKNECQPTVKTSIKFSDSNQLDIEGDKECKCCNVCKKVDCICEKPKIFDPGLLMTSYQEYLSVGLHAEKLKTETILNFDSEDSKGDESPKCSLLKQLLESNLVLSKQKPVNKISEIKVVIDEDICVLNEDSMPQGCSSTNSVRLSTIFEKSENETSQKKHIQNHWNKPMINEKDILEIENSVEIDKKSVKPKLLGISKFLKNISKAVQRKNSRLQEKISISTIFGPRNIAASVDSLVTEIEFGGKKYLVHRSPSPSGSMDCLNSQRTINSDIPSLKSYETPNETGNPLTIIEDDKEDTSDTNAEYSDVIYTKKSLNNINDLYTSKGLLKHENIKSNCDKSCYRNEKKGKETFQEFWKRERFWNNSTTKKYVEGKGICTEELPGERKINKTFSKNLKTEIINKVFEMATNKSSAEKSQEFPNLLATINSSVLHGKHQSDDLPNKNIKRSSQKSFGDLKANSEFSAKGITVGYRKISDSKNLANSRIASLSDHSKMTRISGATRNIKSDISDSCGKDFPDQVGKETIVKDVIVLPRVIKTAKEMKTNSANEESVSEDSVEIMGNEELLSLLENLGKLEIITEESSGHSEKYLSDDSNNEKDCRTPTILRSQNSNVLQSYEKLRPILLEKISKESEHYIYKQICSYLDTTSCRPTSNSNSISTETQIDDTSTKSKLNSSQNSNKQSLKDSTSKQSSESYPSIKSRYRKKPNKISSEKNENILSNLLNKEEVVALMMKYRKERILEEARNNSLRKKPKLKNEKRRKHKDNEARKNQEILKEDKEISNKIRSDVVINDKKISINIEEMFDKRKVEECILEETLENGFRKDFGKRSVDILMEDSEMENELHKMNKKKVVGKCYNYQQSSNISDSSENIRKFVTFSKDSEEIKECSSNINCGEFSGYYNENLQEKYAKSNEHFGENISTSEFIENILGLNLDVKSELSGYTTTNEIKSQNITNETVSNKSSDSDVNKSYLKSLDISNLTSVISSHVSSSPEALKPCRSKFSIKYTTTENSINDIKSKTKETETSDRSINSFNKKKKILDKLKIEIIPICDIKGNFGNESKRSFRDNRVTKALRDQRDLDFKETFERDFIINNTKKLEKATPKICIQVKIPEHQLSSIIETKQNQKISSSIHYNSGLSATTTNYCGFDSTAEHESHNHRTIFEKYRNQKFRNYSFLTSKEEKTSIEDDEYVLAVHNYTTTELLKKVGQTQSQSSKYFATERRSAVISFDENLRPIVSQQESKKVKL